MEVIPDVFSVSLSGHVRFAVKLLASVAARRAEAFCVNTDTGAA